MIAKLIGTLTVMAGIAIAPTAAFAATPVAPGAAVERHHRHPDRPGPRAAVHSADRDGQGFVRRRHLSPYRALSSS